MKKKSAEGELQNNDKMKFSATQEMCCEQVEKKNSRKDENCEKCVIFILNNK